MARPLRIEYPDAVHHVYARGNGRQDIFLNDEDRIAFLEILALSVREYNIICHADCLMDNHYHLEIETPDANLSEAIRSINSRYAQWFNRKHGRVGSLFQGRFGSRLVQRESYLLTLCRYIVLNPVRAGITGNVAEYPWSSYRATAGLEQPHPARTTSWVLLQFGNTVTKAQSAYRHFISEGYEQDQPPHTGGIIGNEDFIKDAMSHIDDYRTISEIPRKQRLADRPALQNIISGTPDMRDHEIAEAILRYGYSQKQAAEMTGLHYTRVCQIIKGFREIKD